MATYVQVNKFAVKDIFDAKYKTRVVAAMQKGVDKAIRDKLTSDVPKTKGAKGYSLDGSLVSLAPDKAGRKLEGKVMMQISSWPGKALKAMPSGTSATSIAGADKIDAGDVDAVVAAAVEAAMKTAASYMESHAP